MLKKRIIPCLDVRSGRVVKGKKFQNIVDVADPVEMAAFYAEAGADELVFYDITASSDNRATQVQFVEAVSKAINIPFTVGGGVKTLEDFDSILKSGADKVSINSSAVLNPQLITDAALKYGNQCVVVSMDVKRIGDSYKVLTHGGRQESKLQAIDWAIEAVSRGAGELVINSVDEDGMHEGYDISLLSLITEAVSVPVIASGGAGCIEDFAQVFKSTSVTGALAASVFHYQTISINKLKNYLNDIKIPVRLI